jgi:hypothetical protein
MAPMDSFRSFAAGLDRWSDFVEGCLYGDGPAGVVKGGPSSGEARRREQAERWRHVWTGNPMDLVHIIGHSRLGIATDHVAGLALLLGGGKLTASVATILRSVVETSARAFWVLDPRLPPRRAIARALTEWIHELHQLSPETKRRVGDSTLEKIVEFAELAGWDVLRDKRSEKPIGVLKGRPTVADLLAKLDADTASGAFRAVAPDFRRSGNAATHGSFLGWAEVVSTREGAALHPMTHRSYSAHLIYALQVHLRAVDAWNAAIDWKPGDLFAEARKAAYAGVVAPYLDLALAHSAG